MFGVHVFGGGYFAQGPPGIPALPPNMTWAVRVKATSPSSAIHVRARNASGAEHVHVSSPSIAVDVKVS